MSKTLVRKVKTKEKGEGQLGVADTDPHELDIRKTRHGAYPAPGTPSGTTWKQQLQKLRDKTGEKSSSNLVSSSTEAMDSDDAQKATTAIVQRLMEKQVKKED